ncbi:Asp23/Gls24 family envelope stress response protein [Patulibacter sp.]|uniref:Asp23/Gls24 family envelope stress response protein n=1 Tax=Patulibacter sp. TaxID=1912859 RepID=UPI002720A9CB|nr:Asp23/Gls24 family envelope stress response protein [Patulibacter sp.]MDO9407979.1 Asp23/Gls24 family envelope stress response protein [Patulibacter sp.]
MTRPPAPTLECGRDLLALVEQVTEELPPADPEHQASCPYCQDALARLRADSGALRELAAEPVRVPRDLSGRLVAGLRGGGRSIVVAAAPGGRDSVAEAVVCRLARLAALAVQGVHQASAVVVHRDAGITLDLHVTAELDRSLPDLATQLREAVTHAVARSSGVRVTAVDVTVDDVV